MNNWEEYDKFDTKTLIEYFQDSQRKQPVRDNALLALYFRFRGDLLNKCEIICKRRGYDIDVATKIAENTLKKYGKSKNFKIEKCVKKQLTLVLKSIYSKLQQMNLVTITSMNKKERKACYMMEQKLLLRNYLI